MYEMKDEYIIGIEMVDNEHRVLFEIAEEIYQLQHNEFIPDKYDYIKEALIKLKDYAITHLEHEEEFMKSKNYKKMFEQLVQHDAFRAKMNAIDFDSLDGREDELIADVVDFLANWLIGHIFNTDMQLRELIDK